MKKILVNGGKQLFGSIPISGMKNAALPVIYASLIVSGKCVIENLPMVNDVLVSFDILRAVGVKVEQLSETSVCIDAENAAIAKVPSELSNKIRASYYLLGAELARFEEAEVGLPGGCDFCVRPIDQHIKAFETLGAKVTVDQNAGTIRADVPDCLQGETVFFDTVTVGATINAMLASVCAFGNTVIVNAAREPHVVDLANFLNTCGADIAGAGTDTIKIRGVAQKKLHGCTYAIIPDMIEAGTYMAAVAAAGGDVTITNVIPKHLETISAKLCDMGAKVIEDDTSVRVVSDGKLKHTAIKTLPYPGFATDMQPQFCVLMCLAEGESTLIEGVWANRFKYVDELKRMGAKITVNDKTAKVTGVDKLHSASVRAVDLRAGAAMIIAALCAEATTAVEDVHLIERGYENIVSKLSNVGADIFSLNAGNY